MALNPNFTKSLFLPDKSSTDNSFLFSMYAVGGRYNLVVDDTIPIFGGDIFEAETNCVK